MSLSMKRGDGWMRKITATLKACISPQLRAAMTTKKLCNFSKLSKASQIQFGLDSMTEDRMKDSLNGIVVAPLPTSTGEKVSPTTVTTRITKTAHKCTHEDKMRGCGMTINAPQREHLFAVNTEQLSNLQIY